MLIPRRLSPVTNQDESDHLMETMRQILSDYEWTAIDAYLDGKSYQEIVDDLGTHRHIILSCGTQL